MRFIPDALGRVISGQMLHAQKNAPTLLFGAGVVSMVGSTVLACRATLKLDDVLEKIERDLEAADGVRDLHPEEYSESDHHQDKVVIYIRGVAKVGKLYGPSIILGGIGIACLTKSHSILMERNAALTAAYVAIDKAFKAYRQRVVDRYGEETDRDLLYDFERVDVVDEETGKVTEEYRILPGEPSKYARWFDEECLNWHAPPFTEYNWVWLRNQQNWANDQLRSKGHMFLNDVYRFIGLSDTSAGAVVGWVYKRDNDRGDNYIDFGCWDQKDNPNMFFENGRDGAILLDFNVDGIIWDLIDKDSETAA